MGSDEAFGSNYLPAEMAAKLLEARPRYQEGFFSLSGGLPVNLMTLLAWVPWVQATDARQEAFFADEPTEYTYGSGWGTRTYRSSPYPGTLAFMQAQLNVRLGARFNVCFLNRYDDEHNQLGWHADDSPGMRHDHSIAVVSFGAEREIWWRENGAKGVVPADQRQALGDGSLFLMPPGFQLTHQHRIPKHGRECGPRVSLTFRRYVP